MALREMQVSAAYNGSRSLSARVTLRVGNYLNSEHAAFFIASPATNQPSIVLLLFYSFTFYCLWARFTPITYALCQIFTVMFSIFKCFCGILIKFTALHLKYKHLSLQYDFIMVLNIRRIKTCNKKSSGNLIFECLYLIGIVKRLCNQWCCY